MATEVVVVESPRGRRIGFNTVVASGIALVVFGLGELLYVGSVGWLGEPALDEIAPGAGPHLFHVLAHALFAWLLLVSLVVQLRHPERKFAVTVFTLSSMIAYSFGTLISGIFDPLELVAVVLFGGLVWLSPGRGSTPALTWHGRSLLASIPILGGGIVLAVSEVGRQVSAIGADEHAEFGHYALMGSVAAIVLVGALIGSSSLPGRRSVAALAVGSLLYIGVASVLFPDQASSLAIGGGIATIAAALIYGSAALTKPSRSA